MSIIIEGPDGAGKTTLITGLTRETAIPVHEKASTSTGGPVDNIADWAKSDLATWALQPLAIYDRHPMFSEIFYGAVIRNHVDPWFGSDEASALAETMMSTGLVIYCLPPIETVMENILVEEQLDGVSDHIGSLYDLYQKQMIKLHEEFPMNVVHYDYTKGPLEYDYLLNRTRAYGAQHTRKRNGRIG